MGPSNHVLLDDGGREPQRKGQI